MVTEKYLVKINKEVYYVDPNYDEKRVLVAKSNPDLKKGEKNQLEINGQEFKILSVKDGDYGFQGMAVVPIVNGYNGCITSNSCGSWNVS